MATTTTQPEGQATIQSSSQLTNYYTILITKVEYDRVFGYECPICGHIEYVIAKHEPKRRYQYNEEYLLSDDPDLAYEPVSISPPTCPTCHVRMKYRHTMDFPLVLVYGRDVDTNKKIKFAINDIEPDFYILKSDIPKLQSLPPLIRARVKRIDDKNNYKDIYGNELAKIITYLPSDISSHSGAIPNFRSRFKPVYQANIYFDVKSYIDALSPLIRIPKSARNKVISKNNIIQLDYTEVNKLPKLRYLIYDIETCSEGRSISDITAGKSQIYSITFYDNYTQKYYVMFNYPSKPDLDEYTKIMKSKIYEYVYQKYCPNCNMFYDDSIKICPDCRVPTTHLMEQNQKFSNYLLNLSFSLYYYPTERDMLASFFATLKKMKPDVMSGHNTSGFDDTVLKNRAYKLFKTPPLPYKRNGFEGIISIDLMVAYDIFFHAGGGARHMVSLNKVASMELKATKYPYEENLDFLYKNDLPTLLTYNLIDVALVVGYNEKIK